VKWSIPVVLCVPLVLSGCFPAVLGSGAAVGSSAAEDRGLDGAAADQNIRARINYEWLHHPGNFDGIEITVYNGKVLLTGKAKTMKDRQDAVRLSKVAPGVREVFDAIEIGDEGTFPDLSRDAWISTKLRSALLFNEHVYSPNYMIRTEDKVVYILGIAENQKELDEVMKEARHVAGVRRVVNLTEMTKRQPKKVQQATKTSDNPYQKPSQPE